MNKRKGFVPLVKELASPPCGRWSVDFRDGTPVHEVWMTPGDGRQEDVLSCTCGRIFELSPAEDLDKLCRHIAVVYLVVRYRYDKMDQDGDTNSSLSLDRERRLEIDFPEFTRSIEESDPEDKEMLRALAVLLMASEVGPNTEQLAEATGYPKSFIDRIAINMQEAGLWINGMVDDREWLYADTELMGERLFAQAHVALGLWKRHRTSDGYSYLNAATGQPVEECRRKPPIDFVNVTG